MISNDKLRKKVTQRLKEMYPVESNKRILELNNVEISKKGIDPEDFNQLDEAIKHNKSISENIYGDFTLKDKETGKKISEKRIKLGELPLYSKKLHSVIANGANYAPLTQFRLKPGAYARIKNNKVIEVFSNVKNGTNLRTSVNPKTGRINLRVHQANIPLYPVLKHLGVSDKQIQQKWGGELFSKNKKYDKEKYITRMHKALVHSDPESPEKAVEGIREYLDRTETTPEINKETLGKAYDKISPDYLLDTSDKAIKVMRGDVEPDNRDSLKYKSALKIDDALDDMLRRAKDRHIYTYKSRYKMDDMDDIGKIVDTHKIKKDLNQFFSGSQLSRFADMTNPITMLANDQRTTLLGPGGIGSTETVTGIAKEVQNTHAGFLDPVHTPESSSAGVTLMMAENTKVEDGKLKTKVRDINEDKVKWMSWEDLGDKALVFPGEFKKKKGKWRASNKRVRAIKGDKRISITPAEARYIIEKPHEMFDTATNMIPFLHSDQGNRQMTGSKMGEQTVSLVNPEKPLVEPILDGKPIRDKIGKEFSITANKPGKVTMVTKKHIIVEDKDGNKDKYPIFRNLYLNGTGFLDADIKVKAGDKVEEGQLLADSNYTRDGKYVDGVNLTTAYVPWKGFTYEDATVLTESAANKLASQHLYRKSLPKDDVARLDFATYNKYAPDEIKEADYDRYDDKGIIKPGQKVKPKQKIIATLKENVPTGADDLKRKLKKSAVPPFQDNSLEWDKEVEGEVVDVVDNKDSIDVYIKTKEPLKKADKIVGSHGNKGVISRIIPDKLAPRTASGEKVEWLINPHSVPSRINWGQILETEAGKLASKTGKPFLVENFSGKDYRKDILDGLKKYNIPEKEDIIDPETGDLLRGVFVGKQYAKKLKQLVDTKYSSRGIFGNYTRDNTPTAGGGVGGQSVDNLTSNVFLAHNARNNLREMFSLKNNPNADYWRAVQHGKIPPNPDIPFEFKKFESYLKGMGVNPKKKGSSITLNPLTDKEIENISKGNLPNPLKSFIGKGLDLRPDKEGLFGDTAGGFQGEDFTHIDLPEKLPAPAFEDSIRTVLHMSQKDYDKEI